MKKILCVALCMLMVVSAMAVEFPGWKCTDIQKLEEARRGYASEKMDVDVCMIDCLIELARKAPASFADIESAVDSIERPSSFDEARFKGRKLMWKKQLSYCKRIFTDEAWEFCKRNPSDYDFYFVTGRSRELNLTDEYIYDFMVDFIIKYQWSSNVNAALRIALNKSIGLDDAKVKSDLQKLNRILSRNLLQDKARWEPIVAEIRTVLETY